MTIPIDGLSPVPPPVSQSPAPGSAGPSGEPDLRETQAGVAAVEESLKLESSKSGPEKDIEAAINDRLARLLRSNIRISIEVDEPTGDFVYKSIDKNTGEVDRQWPPEEVLRMLAFFEELEGLLFDEKA